MFNLKQFLAMSEEELWLWLIKNNVTDGAVLQCKGGREKPCPSPETLADLAFRLRDEADEHSYTNALYKVHLTLIRTKKLCDTEISFQHWTQTRITAIDMIAAALEAKEQSK